MSESSRSFRLPAVLRVLRPAQWVKNGVVAAAYVFARWDPSQAARATGLRPIVDMALAVAALVTMMLLAFGRSVMSLFTETEEILTLGMGLMRILAVGYTLFFLTQCFCGVMSGAGQTTATMRISALATFAIRLPLAWLFIRLTRSTQLPKGRPEALYYSQLCAWLFGTLYSYYLYRRATWRRAAKPMITNDNNINTGRQES